MTVKYMAIWIGWPLLLIAAILLGLKVGVTSTSWQDVYQSLSGSMVGQAEIVAAYRLPRVAAGAIVGVHFALAGLIMQVVLRNPLADPTIFGISGGASLAVVGAMSLSLAVFPAEHSINVSSSYVPLAWLPYIALAGGLTATALVFWLSWDGGFSVGRMTLNGVILGAILNAVVMALVMSLSEARTELAILWLAGSLYARGFEHLLPTLPWTVVGLAVVALNLRSLSALRFDRASALSMGLRIGTAQPALILVAAALASSAVAVAGPIGFVGLLVPHIARLTGARSLPVQVWVGILAGATLVVLGDTLGRIIAPPRELPVGIVTSLIGAPVFAVILSRKMRAQS